MRTLIDKPCAANLGVRVSTEELPVVTLLKEGEPNACFIFPSIESSLPENMWECMSTEELCVATLGVCPSHNKLFEANLGVRASTEEIPLVT